MHETGKGAGAAPDLPVLLTDIFRRGENLLFSSLFHPSSRYVNVGQSDKEVSILLRALPETKGESLPPVDGDGDGAAAYRQDDCAAAALYFVPRGSPIYPENLQVKCGGEQPVCNRCASRQDDCLYKL